MRRTTPFVLNAVLRLSAMGGKFVFLLVAAASMPAGDYGRVGIVLATALIVVAVVGLEGYQTLIRSIVQSDVDEQRKIRGFYWRFALTNAFVSGTVAAVIFAGYGWPAPLVALAAAVVACEHLNIEVVRMLIVEGRPTLSIAVTSMRTGVWGLALPLLALVGVIGFAWDQYLVLAAWLTCSIAGITFALPIRHLYRDIALTFGDYRSRYRALLKVSGIWMLAALAWRTLENGGRLVVGASIGEAASGRFTLLSTIASLALVTSKGILEPMYFPRLVGSDAGAQLRKFAAATRLLVAGSAAACFAVALGYDYLAPRGISGAEWWVLFAVTGASSALALSQVPHFALYRSGHDRVLLGCNALGGTVGLVTACVLTPLFGMVGTGVGLAAGASLLWAAKSYAARRRTPVTTSRPEVMARTPA